MKERCSKSSYLGILGKVEGKAGNESGGGKTERIKTGIGRVR